MKYIAYSFYDKRAEAYSLPKFLNFVPADYVQQITRSLKACKDEKILLQYNDLVLYRIGYFDDESGHIEYDSLRIADFGGICEKLLTELHPVQEVTKEDVVDA